MSTARQKRKPVFDASALDDEIDEMWPARVTACPPSVVAASPAAAAPVAPPSLVPSTTDQVTDSLPPAADSKPERDGAAASARSSQSTTRPTVGAVGDQRRHRGGVTAVQAAMAGKRTRPPEVLLSSEVYDELYRVQLAEKKARRGLARTMGTIVLDAIEAHSTRLATTWLSEQFAIGEGQLFERPSSNAVPRRRRHATAPRTVVLSGVTAANGQRLDNLVRAWDAGTRSALVEQALRYEFDLLH